MKAPRKNQEDLDQDPGLLPHDRIPVRTATMDDLAAIVAIDHKHTGKRRQEFYKRRLEEALRESDVRISLVAEHDGRPAGFLLGRVYFGEFGVMQARAIVDAIGVNPDLARHGVASALFGQLEQNLRALHIEKIQTEVEWEQQDLIAFLVRRGFRPAEHLCLESKL